MDILDGLNDEQREAVLHVQGPLLVVAGAGTGKTQVITRRIAYLIRECGVSPSSILALTFTEKAAQEMQDRVFDLIGWDSFQVSIMTFNAFGSDLLARYGLHIGRSTRGGLLTDLQKALILNQHKDRVAMSYYAVHANSFEFMQTVVNYISQLQNMNISAEQYLEYAQGLRQNPQGMHERDVAEQLDLARIYDIYESIKHETGTFDYNDQIQLPLKIMAERPNIADRLTKQYSQVLVDEYQDTNPAQDALIRSFVPKDGNIFAVGDDDQAIYGFRGADVANILSFPKHFTSVKTVTLVQNYRSAQLILDAAYRLIQKNNPNRLEPMLGINKRLIAQHDLGMVSFTGYGSAQSEVIEVARTIKEQIISGVPGASIGVLAATHAPLRSVAKILSRMGVAYSMSTMINIFDQPELIGLWYLLKWINFDAEDGAIGHILMGPFFRWSPASYREIIDVSNETAKSVESVMRDQTDGPSTEVLSRIDAWRQVAQQNSISHLVYLIVFEGGYVKLWRHQAEDDSRLSSVFDDLHQLLQHMQEFEAVTDERLLSDYLNTFPVPPQIELNEPMGDAGGVKLLTVHASKGLEFEHVYLVSCTQRAWARNASPSHEPPEQLRPKADEASQESEFRRLMYVAVTRAKTDLRMSAPTATASGTRVRITPFIDEMSLPEAAVTSYMAPRAAGADQSAVRLASIYPLRTEQTQMQRLPFELADGSLHLNVTQIAQYEQCPFEFYLEHVLQIRQQPSPLMSFGSIIHRIIEMHYKAKIAGSPLAEEDLLLALDQNWSNRGYADDAAANADHLLASDTIRKFLRSDANRPAKILASEMSIKLNLAEAKLFIKGKIDAQYEAEDGIEIRDFKTGRSKTDSEALAKSAKTNLQLRTYALAYQRLNGVAPSRVVLDYVVTGIEGSATLSPTILRNHADKLAELAGRIRDRNFAPNPSPMHECLAIKYYGTGERQQLEEAQWQEAINETR